MSTNKEPGINYVNHSESAKHSSHMAAHHSESASHSSHMAEHSTKDLEAHVVKNATNFAKLVKTNNDSKKLKNFILGDDFNDENIKKRLDTGDLKLTDEELSRFNTIFSDNLTQIKKRIEQKGIKDLYKIQMLGEALEFQKQFCPGGFKTGGDFGEKLKSHLGGLDSLLMNLLEERSTKIIVSNEALNMPKRLGDLKSGVSPIPIPSPSTNSITNNLVGVIPKEKFSVTYLDGELLTHPVVLHGETFLAIQEPKDKKLYFTSHFSSISESERDEESNKFCLCKLDDLIKKLCIHSYKKHHEDEDEDEDEDESKLGKEELKQHFGGFAGDVNLYLTQDDGNTLRQGVQKILDNYNLVLVTSSHSINKNVRDSIQEQWHKIPQTAKLGSLEKHYVNDSLIVIEPYHKEKKDEYERLSKEKHFNIFMPNSEVFTNKREKKESFDSEFCITDHFIVEGLKLCVFSGADADGVGNNAKRFAVDDNGDSMIDKINLNVDDKNRQLSNLNHLILKIIALINKELSSSPESTMKGGRKSRVRHKNRNKNKSKSKSKKRKHSKIKRRKSYKKKLYRA